MNRIKNYLLAFIISSIIIAGVLYFDYYIRSKICAVRYSDFESKASILSDSCLVKIEGKWFPAKLKD